jgi:hypothetical protein
MDPIYLEWLSVLVHRLAIIARTRSREAPIGAIVVRSCRAANVAETSASEFARGVCRTQRRSHLQRITGKLMLDVPITLTARVLNVNVLLPMDECKRGDWRTFAARETITAVYTNKGFIRIFMVHRYLKKHYLTARSANATASNGIVEKHSHLYLR